MLNLFKRNIKDNSSGVKISNVIPIDWYELIIVLEDGQIRSFDPAKHNLYDKYKFLAYQDKLRSFTLNHDKIEWTNGTAFNSDFII